MTDLFEETAPMKNAAPVAEILPPETEPGTDIAVIVAKDPGIVLLDAGKFDAFFDKWNGRVEAHKPDVSTAKGRDAIKSLAAAIRSDRAAINKARLRLTEEWRKSTTQANAAGKVIDERMDALADKARAALTEWEAEQERRSTERDEILNGMRLQGVVTEDDTAGEVKARGFAVYETVLDPELFGDALAAAEDVKAEVVASLQTAKKRLEKAEADAAELERLRAENAAREEREAEEQRQRDAQAAAEKAEREAEEERKAEAQRAADREREIAEKAAQDARDEEQRVAREAQSKRQYAAQIIEHINEVGRGMIGGQVQPYGILLHELTDKITIDDAMGDMQDAVRAVRDATLKTVQEAMERARVAAERKADDERRAEEQRLEDERRTNREHRTSCKTAAKKAIMTCGADEDTAAKIILAILAGEIPRVTLEY